MARGFLLIRWTKVSARSLLRCLRKGKLPPRNDMQGIFESGGPAENGYEYGVGNRDADRGAEEEQRNTRRCFEGCAQPKGQRSRKQRNDGLPGMSKIVLLTSFHSNHVPNLRR